MVSLRCCAARSVGVIGLIWLLLLFYSRPLLDDGLIGARARERGRKGREREEFEVLQFNSSPKYKLCTVLFVHPPRSVHHSYSPATIPRYDNERRRNGKKNEIT